MNAAQISNAHTPTTTAKRPTILNVNRDMEQMELSKRADGRANSYNTLQNCVAVFTKVAYTQSYDPAIPFLGIYPTDVCSCVRQKICNSLKLK